MSAHRWSIGRLIATVGLCIAGWAIIATLCLMVGSTGSFGWPTNSKLFHYRLDVVMTASLIGAALAAAGVAYQAILRNPLADPYLLGASSGASLAAYLWRFPFLSGLVFSAIGSRTVSSSYLWRFPFLGLAAVLFGGTGQALSQQSFAFFGAMTAVGIVFLLAGRRGRIEPLTLLLVGVIVNSVNGSIFLFVHEMFKNLPAGEGPFTFLVGAIQTNLTTAQTLCAALICAVGWIVLLYVSGELNVASLGDAEALSLGVRINRLRWVALITASLVTASAVAISGPIGFVGLVCPHFARLIVGRDQRILLPSATALGAGLLAVADAVSRKLASSGGLGTDLPVGVLTGLLGGPFFLLLLWQSRRGES